jgi:hypothetical protein
VIKNEPVGPAARAPEFHYSPRPVNLHDAVVLDIRKKELASGAHSGALGKFAAVGDPPDRRFFIEQFLGRQERREAAEKKTIELRSHGFTRTLRAMQARGENIIPSGLLCGNPPAHRKLEIPFSRFHHGRAAG